MELQIPGLKFEILTRFHRLQDCGRAAIRRLQIKECVAVSALYKTASIKAYGKKGITTLRLVENQIIFVLAGENAPREIEDEEQLEEILSLLPGPSGSNTHPAASSN